MSDATNTALAIATTTDLEVLVERAEGYAADARSEATRRAYAADWKAFASWCEGRGLVSMPAPASVVGLYLANLADQGRKVSTIERSLASIAHAHRAAGHVWIKGAPAVREVLAGVRRRVGVAQSKKAPVTAEQLRAMVGALPDARDRAIVLVGFCGAMRRSEIAALTVGDVRFTDDGAIVTIRRSKTDQEGAGREVGLPYAGQPALCPVRALKAWLASRGDAAGPLFGVCDRTVANLVKRAAAAVGLDPEQFGGHSLRAGFATTAAKRGKSLDAIMRQTGHRSERVARGYIRMGTIFEDNAAAGLF